jgi:glycosyltransferase involved in cell wall biosynthesis
MCQRMWVRATLVYRVDAVLTRLVTGGAIGSSGNTGMKPMVILIPSYNNRQWYEQNLESVCAQKYDNFRAIYVDDGSSDQTGPLVEQFLADHAVGHRIQLIRNPVRVGALENLYRCIHTCDDQEIVILLDGDDWLAHPRVLQTLDAVYADPHYGLPRALTLPISRRPGRCWRSLRKDGGTYRLVLEGPHPRFVHPTVTLLARAPERPCP